MACDFIFAAKQNLDSLIDELAALRDQQAIVERKIAGLRAYLNPAPDVEQQREGRATGRQIVDAAYRQIADSPPIRTAELVELLERAGLNLGTKNKEAKLSQLLSRDGRLTASRRNGWSLESTKSSDESGNFLNSSEHFKAKP